MVIVYMVDLYCLGVGVVGEPRARLLVEDGVIQARYKGELGVECVKGEGDRGVSEEAVGVSKFRVYCKVGGAECWEGLGGGSGFGGGGGRDGIGVCGVIFGMVGDAMRCHRDGLKNEKGIR